MKNPRFSYAVDHHHTKGLLERLSQLRNTPFSFERKHYDNLIFLLQVEKVATILAARENLQRFVIKKLFLNLYQLFISSRTRKHKKSKQLDDNTNDAPDSIETAIIELEQMTNRFYDISMEYIQSNSSVLYYLITSDTNISEPYKALLLSEINRIFAEIAKPDAPDMEVIKSAPIGLQIALLGQAVIDDNTVLHPKEAIKLFAPEVESDVERVCYAFCERNLPYDLLQEDKNNSARPKPEPTPISSNQTLFTDAVRNHLVGGLLIRRGIPDALRTTNDIKMSIAERDKEVMATFEESDPNSELVKGLLAVLAAAKQLNRLNLAAEQHANELKSSIGQRTAYKPS